MTCFCVPVMAQVPYTEQTSQATRDSLTRLIPPKKASTRFVTEDDINRNITFHPIDTGLNRIEIFHNLYRNYAVFQDLGNIGTPSRPLIFGLNREVGFRLGDNPFEGYWMKPELTKFYNTKTPYTDLFYAQGSNELIYLQARHSQNITPRWNIGADLQRITSVGFLASQYTSIYNYQFFTRFLSKNRKYDILAHATWNRGIVEESGGIASDSAFESLSGSNKKVTPNLFGSQTRFKSRTAYIKQYWHFGKSQQIIRDEDTTYEMKSRGQLSYSVKAEEISFIFENLKGDTNSLLLPNRYYDTLATTFDSTYYGKLENRIALDLFNEEGQQKKDSVRKYLGIGLTHDLIVTSQNPYIRNYTNMIGDVTLERICIRNYSFSWRGFAAYDFSGYNSGDYKARAFVKFRLPALDIGVESMQQLYKPDYTFLLFKTNQFIWKNENSFYKTLVTETGFIITTRRLRHNFNLVIRNYLLNDWVYADTAGLPAQSHDKIIINVAELSKTFQLWKFYFEHHIIFQQSSSEVIRVPDLSGVARYYFQSSFKRMRFQIGLDVFYNTAYYANNYNPASRLFFLQNERLVGNYPVIDPFITGHIKRAEFFVKYEHVNQDLFNQHGFYYTPHYPISLSSFRMGIRWRFYD